MKNKILPIAAVCLVLIIGIWINRRMENTSQTVQNANIYQQLKSKTMDNNLKIEDLTVGNGQEAKKGDTVAVNYIGTLENGSKFDSSYDRNQPFVFNLGGGQVIKGWDEGIAGMKVGGKRKLTIPPDMGYGAGGYPPVIPPSATLIFTVELVAIK